MLLYVSVYREEDEIRFALNDLLHKRQHDFVVGPSKPYELDINDLGLLGAVAEVLRQRDLMATIKQHKIRVVTSTETEILSLVQATLNAIRSSCGAIRVVYDETHGRLFRP